MLAELALLITTASATLEEHSQNTLYVELVGSAPVVSLNYERAFSDHLGLRFGVGYLRATGFTGANLDRFEFPLVSALFFGSRPHQLEVGLGIVPSSRIEAPATVVIGYRYRPEPGGFNFRAALTPLIDLWDPAWSGFPIVPLIGLSFGYGF